MGSKFETTPERCFFLETKFNQFGVPAKSFKRKMIDLLDHFAEDSTERLFVFVMLTKCCIFAIKNGIVTLCQSCELVRFLVNTATFVEKTLGF